MKNAFVKTLSLFLILATIFTVSCKKPKDDGEGTKTVAPGTVETLWKKGATATDCVVIYNESSANAAAGILDAILTEHNLSPYAYEDTEKAEGAREILIGNTNRALSATLVAAVEAKKAADGGLAWGFAYAGGKFAVYATDDTAYDGTTAWENCITDFSNSFLQSDFKGTEGNVDVRGITAAELAEGEEAQNGPTIQKLKNQIKQTSAKNFGTIGHVVAPLKKASTTPASGVHPRVGLTASRVSELGSLVGTGNTLSPTALYYQCGENSTAWQTIVKLTEATAVKSMSYGTLPDKGASASNGNFGTLETIEALAFRYAVEHKRENDEATIYGLRAVNALLNYLYSENITKDIDSLVYRRAGYVMYISAEVYDWCYDLMTDKDRENIVKHITSYDATLLEVAASSTNITPSGLGAVVGHGSEAQLLRDWLAFAIAVYDEYPEYYEYVGSRIETYYVPVRNQYYVSETVSQGTSYGIYRLNFDINAEMFYESMQNTDTPKKLFDVDFSALVRGLMYQVRPDDTLLRLGDGMNERTLVVSTDERVYKMWDYGKTMFYASALTGDGMAKSEAYKYLKNFTKYFTDDNSLSCTQFLVYNDLKLERISSETLPLANYFPSPSGSMVAFNSWGADGAMVYMKVGEKHSGNHEHGDIGQFQIYYKGALAIDAGYYDAYSTNAEDYCRSALAHNVLMIGGKGQAANTAEPGAFEDMKKTATVIGESIVYDGDKPTNVYLAGDIHASYTTSQTLNRYMLAVYNYDDNGNPTGTPLCFFVMDSFTASSSQTVDFLLHSIEEPTVSGNTVVVKNTEDVRNGQVTIDCDGVLVDQAFVDAGTLTLTKEKTSYGKTGGVENVPQDRWDYDVDYIESGWGYVTVKTEGSAVNMLNVMYVTDTATYAAEGNHTATQYSNETVLGASIADLGVAAFFNKTTAKLTSATVQGTGNGTLRYSVCGMAAGTYTVKNAGGNTVATVTVTGESGMLNFSAAAGTYTIAQN